MIHETAPTSLSDSIPGLSEGQVAGFDPDNGFLVHEWMMLAQVRAAHPGPCGITTVLVTEFTVQNQYFLPAKMPMRLKSLGGRPFHQCNVLMPELMQGHHFQPPLARQPACGVGINAHRTDVFRVELMEFYEQNAAFLAERCMATARRITQIGTRAVITRFIRKHAFEHQDFLTQRVFVPGKAGPRLIAHNAGGMTTLSLLAGQRFTLDSSGRAGRPLLLRAADNDFLTEIHV